jgi:hypothetical protein
VAVSWGSDMLWRMYRALHFFWGISVMEGRLEAICFTLETVLITGGFGPACYDGQHCLFTGWWCDVAFKYRFVLIAFPYPSQPKDIFCFCNHRCRGNAVARLSQAPSLCENCCLQKSLSISDYENVVYVRELGTGICGPPVRGALLRVLHEILQCSASFQSFYVQVWT